MKFRGLCCSPGKALGQGTAQHLEVLGFRSLGWLCPLHPPLWFIRTWPGVRHTSNPNSFLIAFMTHSMPSFIKGQCIKQSSSFSLIYIYFVLAGLLPFSSPSLRLLSIACSIFDPSLLHWGRKTWEGQHIEEKSCLKLKKLCVQHA